MKKYTLDKKFKKTIGKTNLVKLVLVFCGTELSLLMHGDSLKLEVLGLE